MPKYSAQDTLGDILHKQRRDLGLTIKVIAQETKILPKYLEALEENNYSIFSSVAHAKGFLKIYALALGLDAEKVLAVYRRDIVVAKEPRVVQPEAPLPETKQPWGKIHFTRRQLIIAGGILTLLLVSISILASLGSVFQAPALNLSDPIRLDGAFNGTIDINARSIRFRGNTSPQTVVRLNGTPLSIQSDNTFATEELPLAQETTLFTLVATNQFGRTTEIVLNVTRTLSETPSP